VLAYLTVEILIDEVLSGRKTQFYLTTPALGAPIEERAFAVAGPTVWNCLPSDIRHYVFCRMFFSNKHVLWNMYLSNAVSMPSHISQCQTAGCHVTYTIILLTNNEELATVQTVAMGFSSRSFVHQ